MGILDDRVALVTGAGAGIGRAHALALAVAGARVVVNDIGVDLDGGGGSRAPADEVVAEIVRRGGQAVASFDSVAGYASAGAIVETALRAFGRLDIVINNASVFRDGPFATMTPEDFAADLTVHLGGTFNICKHALPLMVAQGRGRIINTSSPVWHGASGLAAYAAAKAGIVGLSFDLAAEYWAHGVTVNVLLPGALTEHRQVQGRTWLGRLEAAGVARPSFDPSGPTALTPDHVPPLAVYLASDEAGDISGMLFEAVGNTVGVYAHPAVVRRASKDAAAPPWTLDEVRRATRDTLLTDRARAPHLPERTPT